MSVGCQFVTFVLKQHHCSLFPTIFPLQTHFPAWPLRAFLPRTLVPPGSAACPLPLGLSCDFH